MTTEETISLPIFVVSQNRDVRCFVIFIFFLPSVSGFYWIVIFFAFMLVIFLVLVTFSMSFSVALLSDKTFQVLLDASSCSRGSFSRGLPLFLSSAQLAIAGQLFSSLAVHRATPHTPGTRAINCPGKILFWQTTNFSAALSPSSYRQIYLKRLDLSMR